MPNTPDLSHSFTKLSHFCDVGSGRGRATNFLWALELEEQQVKIWLSFGFLSVHSLTYLSSSTSFSTLQGNMGSFHSFYNEFHGNLLQWSHNWMWTTSEGLNEY